MAIDSSSIAAADEVQTIAGGSSFPEQRWQIRDVALGLLLLFVVRVGAGFLPLDMKRQWWVPINVLFVSWLWFYPITVARIRGVEFRWPTVRHTLREALLAIPILMGIWVCLAISVPVLRWLLPSTTIDNVNPFIERVAQSHDDPWLWAMLLAGAVFAPIAEELFFRGMVYRYLKQISPTWFAVVVQAVLFGFVHPFGVFHALMASLLGVSFALVYEWRKTIIAPMSLHVLQNVIALTMTVLVGLMLANGPALGVFGEADPKGCRMTAVEPGGSADTAGVFVGDVLTEFDGNAVKDFQQLRWLVRVKQIGDRVTIKLLRNNEPRTIEVELRKRQKSAKSGDH
jgi:membrane protease YdiL (CAAX protease family)